MTVGGPSLAERARRYVRGTALAVRAAAPARAGVAARAALAVAVPLTAGALAGRPQLGAAASFGALAVLYVPQAPYRYRAQVVAWVGAGLVLAVLLGALAADRGALTVLVVGLVAGLASFACQAAELPPPRELMVVMAVLAATDVPGSPPTLAALAAGGAAVAWLLTMAPALTGDRRAPERAAVSAALTAIAGLLDAVGSPDAPAARYAAVVGVARARSATAAARLPDGHPLVALMIAAETLLEIALHVEVEATGPLDPGWGAAVRALPPGPDRGAADLPDPDDAVGAGLLARAITDARRTDGRPSPSGRTVPSWPRAWQQFDAALRRHSVVLPAAARIGIAVGVGVGIGQALGLGHAYWVGLTAAAVLQGSNLAVTRGRMLHRMAGTVVGVGLTFAVLGWGPPVWLVVLVVVAAQFVVDLVIPVHYGLAVTGITVLALGLFHLGAPAADVHSALVARLVDTVIGAVLALVLRRVLWPRATVTWLPQRQARVVRAARDVLAAAWSADRERLPQRRHALQTELAALRAVHTDALGDTGTWGDAGDADRQGPHRRDPRRGAERADTAWPASAAAEELGFLALALPRDRPPPPPVAARTFLDHLDELEAALSAARPAPARSPGLPDHPRTAAAAAALTAAVGETRT